MSDLFDKAILIAMGLEKKASEVLTDLQKTGKKATKDVAGGEDLPPREAVENKVVEEGVSLLREFVSSVRSVKEKFEKDASGTVESVMERLNVPTRDEIDVVKEMARITREKTEELEKRLAELEAASEKKR